MVDLWHGMHGWCTSDCKIAKYAQVVSRAWSFPAGASSSQTKAWEIHGERRGSGRNSVSCFWESADPSTDWNCWSGIRERRRAGRSPFRWRQQVTGRQGRQGGKRGWKRWWQIEISKVENAWTIWPQWCSGPTVLYHRLGCGNHVNGCCTEGFDGQTWYPYQEYAYSSTRPLPEPRGRGWGSEQHGKSIRIIGRRCEPQHQPRGCGRWWIHQVKEAPGVGTECIHGGRSQEEQPKPRRAGPISEGGYGSALWSDGQASGEHEIGCWEDWKGDTDRGSSSIRSSAATHGTSWYVTK